MRRWRRSGRQGPGVQRAPTVPACPGPWSPSPRGWPHRAAPGPWLRGCGLGVPPSLRRWEGSRGLGTRTERSLGHTGGGEEDPRPPLRQKLSRPGPAGRKMSLGCRQNYQPSLRPSACASASVPLCLSLCPSRSSLSVCLRLPLTRTQALGHTDTRSRVFTGVEMVWELQEGRANVCSCVCAPGGGGLRPRVRAAV